MSANRHRPHVLVLPEDDANRQLANGFLLGLDQAVLRNIQVVEEAGGWRKVLDCFESDHVVGMKRYPGRYMVLLIDFDGDVERFDAWRRTIPEDLAERVFILGALSEPEELRRVCGAYEEVGLALARECRDSTVLVWGHDLLRHNATELGRMRELIRPILF